MQTATSPARTRQDTAPNPAGRCGRGVRRRLVRASCVLPALVALASACDRTGRHPALHGRTPVPALHAGGVTLPEVRAGAPETTFTLRAAPGGLLLVYFGYTSCPDICPTTFSDLRRALRHVGPDSARVDVAFVTVDRARDSAAVLLTWLGAYGFRAHPLRPHDDLGLALAERALGATSLVQRRPGGGVDVSHTGLTSVLDPRGDVLVQWDYGTRADDMAADLRALLAPGRPR